MNVARNSVKTGLAVAALVVICSAQVSLAGYSYTLVTNWGTVWASLGSTNSGSYTNRASTPNMSTPSAAVTPAGTYSVKTNLPPVVSTGNTSTVQVLNVFGWKAVAHSWTTTGASADPSQDLTDKLTQDGFSLTPSGCGAGYGVSSGEEIINGQRYVVVLGNATGGTATWFRGYVYDGPVNSRDDIIAGGAKLYDIVLTGPFDFGDINSSDRCNAIKIAIAYTGPNLYLISDGTAISTTDLQINCPSPTITLAPCNPSYPTNTFATAGGCPPAVVTFDTDPNSIAPGASATVTATATDSAGNVATCQFTATRTGLQFTGCPPNSTIALSACNPSYPTNSFTTTGGCGTVTISFSPPASSIPLGATSAAVTATATDTNGTTATCVFWVSRPAALQFTGCPGSIVLGACNPPNYPTNMFTTGGGCAPVIISFSPPASSIVPGAAPVSATAFATDANNTTVMCPFTVSRPALQISGCPPGPLDFSTCGTTVAYPNLTVSGGCAPMTLTFNPTNVSALLPGTNNVIATAKDANGAVVTCQFEVIRPYLSLGSAGFASPIGGLGGTCAAPLRVNNSGSNLKIAFSTSLCGTAYNTIVPKITIVQLDANCNATTVEVKGQPVTLINSQWHYNWSTGGNHGNFRISVDLGDGNPNAGTQNSAIIQLP
jgi:hypothetical protein